MARTALRLQLISVSFQTHPGQLAWRSDAGLGEESLKRSFDGGLPKPGAGPRSVCSGTLQRRGNLVPFSLGQLRPLLAAFRLSVATAVATSPGFTWGTTEILFIVLPQEQRGLIPHSTSLDARTSNSQPQ
jgi:hypothetical protein